MKRLPSHRPTVLRRRRRRTSYLLSLDCTIFNSSGPTCSSTTSGSSWRSFRRLNAELLLRITRISGSLLRHDDPSALKDIVSLIGVAVAKIGKDKINVRTSVMINSINDLKNNKRANEGRDGVMEYTTQTKKVLGSLNARKLEATEPLRIGLKDIQESRKKGEMVACRRELGWQVFRSPKPGRILGSPTKTATRRAALPARAIWRVCLICKSLRGSK